MIECLTVQQAADFIGVNKRHVYYLVDMGSIEAFKVGKLWRFYREAIDRYVRSKNVRRTYQRAAGHPDDRRSGDLFELFYGNHNPADKTGRYRSLPNPRRVQPVEYQQGGFSQVSIKKHKPVRPKSKYISPLQLELCFDAAG
jgi:excisionase family DNA binding protein